MRHVAAPTHVGLEHWPVLSAVRVGTTDHPAEFVVLADCGESTPTDLYATFRVFVWSERSKATDAEYDLSFVEAQRSLAERAGLIPMTTTTVEVVVVRDPDFANDYTVFIDGRHQPTGETGTVPVVTHDIDLGADEITGEWVADQLHNADPLSPAAAQYTRATIHSYAGGPAVTRLELRDPTAPAGQPESGVPARGWRLLCVSVRGNHGYLVGNPTVHPIDLDPGVVPAGVGTRFADLNAIKGYVRTELRGVSAYWQVRVIDDAGTVVMYGFRAGPGGTGERWTWRPAEPADQAPSSTDDTCR